MQSDKNTHQSQLPSLEEGPMRSQGTYDETYFNQVKRKFSYPRCLDIIKVLLYLELILFILWIGGLFITNLHLDHPSKVDDSPYDPLSTNDLHTVNTESAYSDYAATIDEDGDDIFSFERSRISATSVTSVTTDRNDLAQTKTAKPPSSDTKEPIVDTLLMGSLENLDIPVTNEDSGKDDEGEKIAVSDGKTEPDVPKQTIAPNDDGEDFTNSGLIHVIDDHVSDVKVDSIMNDADKYVSVPFPLPPWLLKKTVAATEEPKDEVDYSNEKLEIYSTEKTTLDEILDTPPAVMPKFGILFFLNMSLDNDYKLPVEDVGSDLEEMMALENDLIEKDSIASSSQAETQQPEKGISLWELLQVISIPKITFDIKYGSGEDKDSGDASKSGSPVDEIGITDNLTSPPPSVLDMTDATVARDFDADDMSNSQMHRNSFSQDRPIVQDIFDFEETDKSDEDISPWHWIFQLSMPSSNDQVNDNNVGETESSEVSTSDSLKEDTLSTDAVEDSESTLPNSNPVDSVDNQLFDEKTDVPLPLWLEKNKTTVADDSRVEDDSSTDNSEAHSIERTSVEDFDNSPPILPTPDMKFAFAYDDYDLKELEFPELNWAEIGQNSQETFGDDIVNKKSLIEDFGPDMTIEDDKLHEDLYEDYLNGSF